jgi:Skp family chaperone for outer membrane proteins
MSDKPAAPFNEEILLIAEKVGQLSDRFARIEAEFTTQTAPLDASKGAIDGAVTALNAALTGIKALNFHVLDNNLGAVSKRVEEISVQADTALRALEAKLETSRKELAKADADALAKLGESETRRTELAAKREEDARDFAAKVEAARTELSQQIADLKAKLGEAVKNFATPSSFNPRGQWEGRETYARLDVVSLNGSSYVSLSDGNTEKPSKTARNWMLLAARGAASGNGASAFEPSSLASLTAGATITWDLGSPVASVTLGAAANAFTFQNGRTGGTYVLILKQDSNGSRTVSWPSSVKWPGNTAPVLTTTASRADVFSFVYDGTVYYGSGSQNYPTS